MPPTPSLWHRRRRPPTWQASGPRGRVLVEHPDPRVREAVGQGLTEHGYHVLACGGPSAVDAVSDCPVLRGQRCPAIDGADAVVVDRRLDEAGQAALVDQITRLHPRRPVVVEADLRVDHPLGGQLGRHTIHRTVVAPLVRRLHDLLHGGA